MALIRVALENRGYDVHIGQGLLGNIAQYAAAFVHGDHVPIIADSNAHHHWGAVIAQSLAEAGIEPRWYLVPSGEAEKSWQRLEHLANWLLAQGVTRSDHVFALGGGVVGDLTGFACAILKRGCGFVQLPTTLLAQVDSSVGGKTAINTASGKNLIGAFHQPSLVLADTSTLATLPPRELRAGYAEIIKYGILGDADFFTWLEAHGAAVLAGEAKPLEHAVATSIATKARIVAQDERETSGTRALLNLGHTFGHALEAETGYSDALLHGEAVALGMVLAARYSVRKGLLEESAAMRITREIAAVNLPASLSALALDCDGKTLAGHMLHDKKMEGGTLPFILLEDIGAAFLSRDVAMADIAAFLDVELARK